MSKGWSYIHYAGHTGLIHLKCRGTSAVSVICSESISWFCAICTGRKKKKIANEETFWCHMWDKASGISLIRTRGWSLQLRSISLHIRCHTALSLIFLSEGKLIPQLWQGYAHICYRRGWKNRGQLGAGSPRQVGSNVLLKDTSIRDEILRFLETIFHILPSFSQNK